MKPLSHPTPTLVNHNFSILVRLRRLPQTRDTAEGVGTCDVAEAGGLGQSVQYRLMRESNALLRREETVPREPTGTARYTGSGALPSPLLFVDLHGFLLIKRKQCGDPLIECRYIVVHWHMSPAITGDPHSSLKKPRGCRQNSLHCCFCVIPSYD